MAEHDEAGRSRAGDYQPDATALSTAMSQAAGSAEAGAFRRQQRIVTEKKAQPRHADCRHGT
jgi:hypothetical protein